MNTIARDVFDAGKRDVECYFEFIKATVDAPPPTGESKIERDHRQHLHKILKANTVLVLYNLVESTVTNGLIALYTDINANRADFVRLTDKLRAAWIAYEVRNVSRGNPNEHTIYQCVERIAGGIANRDQAYFPLDSKSIRLSGNVDADQIRKVAHEHGFAHSTGTTGEGNNLERVKTDRNRLAHGLSSFSECGKHYSILELEGIKDQVLQYLDKVIENIENSADRQQYLAGTPP